MAGYLHYAQDTCSLNDIVKNTCINPVDIDTYTQVLAAANHGVANPSNNEPPHIPFILPESATSSSFHIPACTPQEHNTLKSLSQSMGGAGVMALADLLWETKLPSYIGDANTFAGGVGAATTTTSSHMLHTIAKYETLLKEYEDLRNHRATAATLNRKSPALKAAFNEMNTLFNRKGQSILHKHAVKTKMVVNQTGRVVSESIPISSQADVQKLASLAKIGRIAGPGLIVLDGYIRANGVYHAYNANDPTWKRQAVVQSAGFTAGVIAAGAIGFLIALSPLGLVVGLVVGGAAALGVDFFATNIAGRAYDWARQ
jgi:hypothetical protein